MEMLHQNSGSSTAIRFGVKFHFLQCRSAIYVNCFPFLSFRIDWQETSIHVCHVKIGSMSMNTK